MPRKERRPRAPAHGDTGVSITAAFTYSASLPSHPQERVTHLPPPWLMEPASAVLDDLMAAGPIAGLQIVANPLPDLNGLTLGVIEESAVSGELVELPDDLDPDEPTGYPGGNWVPRSLTEPDVLVVIADILQADLAESSVAWGQARPPCPNHPHPARPGIDEGQAWWVCPRDTVQLYRIGRREVPSGGLRFRTWQNESRRARKRRHR
jgi:hypothetical protein